MFSYWEKTEFEQLDVAIIGSGFTGLSLAASLIERNPKLRIALFESGFLPTGASTKNAGFACFGSISEMVDDLTKMSEEEWFTLVKNRHEGLEIHKRRIDPKRYDFIPCGGYELLDEKSESALNHLDAVNQKLLPYFKQNVFSVDNNKIDAFGFSKNHVKHLVFNPLEGQLNPTKLLKSLLTYVQSKGVLVHTGTRLLSWEEDQNKLALNLNSNGKTNTVFARKMAICTNAFAKALLPNLELEPGRGQVLITKELDEAPFNGVFHYDDGYYYFRNVGKRVLLGGGRNLDFKTENTNEFALNPHIQDHLKRLLKELILPNTPFEIEHQWAGIMAFGENKRPIVEQLSEHLFVAVRLGGMGVALSGSIGEQLSEKIIIGLD
jgi:glycine/D-amino acid oxidase-like deaminating enzyme